MPDQPNNIAPRPSTSDGRGALGSPAAATSLETPSSQDTPPTGAVGQPNEDASLASAAGRPDKAATEGSKEGRSLEPQSRRRLFAGVALGAISLAGLTLSLLLLVAPGVLPGTGGTFPEGATPFTQSLFTGESDSDGNADGDSGRAGTEGALGGAASADREARAATDGAGTVNASTTESSANGAAANGSAAADGSAGGNGRSDSYASAESAGTDGRSSSGNSTGSGSGTGAGAGRGSGSSAASSPSASSGASGSSGASPSPAPASIAVSVVVDSSAAASLGYPAAMASGTLQLPEDATAYDALAATGLSLEGSASYVSAVNGLAEKMMGGTSGWTYTVNGTMPMTAASNYTLHEGDAVRWVYVS